jgi:hypothetical protein
VCQLLYIIVFVPYNLFKLFLVHKISAYIYIYIYIYIYENGKRKKKKEFSASWAGGGGGILAQPSVRAGQATKPAHGGAATMRRTSWVWAHASARGGGGG